MISISWIGFIGLGFAALGGVSGCAKPIQDQAPPPRIVEQTGEQPLWDRPGDGDVTRAYGRARVKEGVMARVQSISKPWSGYWYSVESPFLFHGIPHEPAPLERYDSWVRKAHKKENPHAAEFEKDRIYDAAPLDDPGLWMAWATASALEAEPKASRNIDGVDFGVGDLKALLVMTYEVLPPGRVVTFGKKEESARGLKWRDIPPDQFHRVLQAELLEHRHSILLGRDTPSTYSVVPVYAAQVTAVKDVQDPHLMHVTTTLNAADYLGDPTFFPRDRDFVGTREVNMIYTYDLYGVPQQDGSLDVRNGEWTGDSVSGHPDFISAITEWNLPAAKRRGTSRNSEVKTQYVDEILTQKPDSLPHATFPGIFPIR